MVHCIMDMKVNGAHEEDDPQTLVRPGSVLLRSVQLHSLL